MKKILVLTGATGKKSGGVLTENIGKNIKIIRKMYPDGIRAIVRASSDTKELERLIPEVNKITGDLTDVPFLKKAFQDADTIVHVAGIHWSKEIADAAAYCGVRRLVLVHTTGIYSKYKEAGEEYRKTDNYVYNKCKENNIILTILRPTMIYGNTKDNNVVTLIKMVDKFPLMPVVSGAKYDLQPVHYRDLGNAYYAVLTNEKATANKDYILSGGEPIQLRDMLIEIGKNLDKKVRFISCPFWIAYSGAWLLYGLTFKRKDYREKVQRLCEPRVYAHTEATADFDYQPRCFQDGIKEEVKEYLRETSYGR